MLASVLIVVLRGSDKGFVTEVDVVGLLELLWPTIEVFVELVGVVIGGAALELFIL